MIQAVDSPVERAAAVRDWWVISTAIMEVVLIVRCRRTGAVGIVRDPSREEWDKAFHAPSNPYPWTDSSRVKVIRNG